MSPTTNFTDATLKGTVTGPTFTGSVDGAKFTGSVTTTDVPPDPPPVSKTTRNVFQQPFGINSIWNTPIGVGTGSLVAGSTGSHGGKTFKYANNNGPVYEFAGEKIVENAYADEHLILFGPSSPQKQVYTNTADWSGANRCTAQQTATGAKVPVPAKASYPNGTGSNNPCAQPNTLGNTGNNCGCILLADRTSLYQQQPMQVCSVGGSPTTHWFFDGVGHGTEEQPRSNVDIFADETTATHSSSGSHGGSAMSAIGGTIRYNDIIPGNCPVLPGVADVMRHALQFAFNSGLFDAFTGHGGHVWPATADNGDRGNEGLLLALLPTFDLASLGSVPGRSVAWTLMNYGAYTVDDAGWDCVNLSTEYSYGDNSVNCPTGRSACQFQNEWGYTIFPLPLNSNPFGQDLAKIFKNMYVITNNALTHIGGPGSNRTQPLAVAPTDPGVITTAPSVTKASFSHRRGSPIGQLIGQVSASQSPFWWTLKGTGAANFWIQPTTGLVCAAVGNIAAGTYTLTATAQNIVGSGQGQVVIVVS